MAGIFLSYAREDADTAKRIAAALESAGHSVWWDREIHAGERFSAEIDKALKSAELVVVLWSRGSIDSPWVQDEAAVGRDTGRLVPVLIEPVEPPLGFRQYHAVDLSSRRGRGRFQPIVEAIGARSGARRDSAPTPAPTRRFPRHAWMAAAALAIFAMLAVGAWRFWPRATSATAIVQVAPAPGVDQQSRDLAQAIALDLG